MKTAEEWIAGLGNTRGFLNHPRNYGEFIRAIQADALRHAAQICIERKQSPPTKNPGYQCACDECSVFILAEAERIKKGGE